MELKCGGHLLDRHEPPFSRRFVVYFRTAVYKPLILESDDGAVQIAARGQFTFVPFLFQTTAEAPLRLRDGLARLRQAPDGTRTVLVMPMDILSDGAVGGRCVEFLRSSKTDWLIVGQSMAQLWSEVEQKLAITAEQIDENEVDASNVDKHTD